MSGTWVEDVCPFFYLYGTFWESHFAIKANTGDTCSWTQNTCMYFCWFISFTFRTMTKANGNKRCWLTWKKCVNRYFCITHFIIAIPLYSTEIYFYFFVEGSWTVFKAPIVNAWKTFTLDFRSMQSYFEQWLRLMLRWDPKQRGGGLGENRRPQCFTFLDTMMDMKVHRNVVSIG